MFQNYGYADLDSFTDQINDGKIDIATIKEEFPKFAAQYDAIEEEISDNYKKTDLQKKVYHTSSDSKKDLVQKYRDNLFYGLVPKQSVTITFGKPWIEAMQDEVEKSTQADLDKYVADIAERRAERKARNAKIMKALDNPEDLEEFNTFIKIKGKEKLTAEQLRRYEQLVAEGTLKKFAEKKVENKTLTKVELGDVKMELKTTKHTKKGHDLWVVVMGWLPKPTYKELLRRAQALGGRYSFYKRDGAIPGFQFTSEESAKKFMQLKDGDVNLEDEIADKYAKKQDKRVAKLLSLADRWEAKGQEKLSQERKTNTARRARMAASAEEDAAGLIWFAKVVRNIATGIESGEIKYLVNLDSAAQLADLKQLLGSSYWRRIRTVDYNGSENRPARDLEEDLQFVEYPVPCLHRERMQGILSKLKNTKGAVMAVRRLQKKFDAFRRKNPNEWRFCIKSFRELEDLEKITPYIRDNYDRGEVKEEINKLKRIRRMGLVNISTLKVALREYHAFSQIDALSPEQKREKELKELERQFVGRKIDGFFPTPPPLIEEMFRMAHIREGDTILEPSAGLGHIADAIAAEYPENDLEVIEYNYSLREALKKKGHNVVGEDFLQYESKKYDVILMNPPFEKDQDIQHVMRAYQLLKPHGRLVAIMANNKQGTRGLKKDWQAFVEETDAYSEVNEAGSFKSAFRPTGVNTVMVTIQRGDYDYEENLETQTSQEQSDAGLAEDTDGEIFIPRIDTSFIPSPRRAGYYDNGEWSSIETNFSFLGNTPRSPVSNPSKTMLELYEELRGYDSFYEERFKPYVGNLRIYGTQRESLTELFFGWNNHVGRHFSGGWIKGWFEKQEREERTEDLINDFFIERFKELLAKINKTIAFFKGDILLIDDCDTFVKEYQKNFAGHKFLQSSWLETYIQNRFFKDVHVPYNAEEKDMSQEMYRKLKNYNGKVDPSNVFAALLQQKVTYAQASEFLASLNEAGVNKQLKNWEKDRDVIERLMGRSHQYFVEKEWTRNKANFSRMLNDGFFKTTRRTESRIFIEDITFGLNWESIEAVLDDIANRYHQNQHVDVEELKKELAQTKWSFYHAKAANPVTEMGFDEVVKEYFEEEKEDVSVLPILPKREGREYSFDDWKQLRDSIVMSFHAKGSIKEVVDYFEDSQEVMKTLKENSSPKIYDYLFRNTSTVDWEFSESMRQSWMIAASNHFDERSKFNDKLDWTRTKATVKAEYPKDAKHAVIALGEAIAEFKEEYEKAKKAFQKPEMLDMHRNPVLLVKEKNASYDAQKLCKAIAERLFEYNEHDFYLKHRQNIYFSDLTPDLMKQVFVEGKSYLDESLQKKWVKSGFAANLEGLSMQFTYDRKKCHDGLFALSACDDSMRAYAQLNGYRWAYLFTIEKALKAGGSISEIALKEYREIAKTTKGYEVVEPKKPATKSAAFSEEYLNMSIEERVEKRLRDAEKNKKFKDSAVRKKGARKESVAYDFITLENLAQFEEDPVLARKMVVKNKVWPEVAVAEQKAMGVSSGAAYWKVQLRKSCAAKPKDDKHSRSIYLKGLQSLWEKIKPLKKLKEIREATDLFIRREVLILIQAELAAVGVEPNYTGYKKVFGQSSQSRIIRSIFSAQFDNMCRNYGATDAKIRKMNLAESYNAITAEMEAEYTKGLLTFQKKRIERLEEEGVRNNPVREQYRLDSIKNHKEIIENIKAGNIGTKYKQREEDWSWFEGAKEGAKANNADRLKKPMIHTKPPLSHIERKNGLALPVISAKDIEKLYLGKLGMESVEYGNALPDRERELHAKYYYQAMIDLEELTGLDIRKINQFGKLGIGFATRGRGRAYATYYSGYRIINLTRKNGDGTVAHEWAHYLDDILSKNVGKKRKINGEEGRFATENGAVNSRVQEKISQIFKYITFGDGEAKTVKEIFYAQSKKGYRIKLKDTFEETLKANRSGGLSRLDNSAYQKDVIGWMLHKHGMESAWVEFENKTSQFYANSLAMGSKYWFSRVELFARAFESFIWLEMQKSNKPFNNYLQSLNDPRYKDIGLGFPYPKGEEAKDLARLYRELMEIIAEEYDAKSTMDFAGERENVKIELEVKQVKKRKAKVEQPKLDLDDKTDDAVEPKPSPRQVLEKTVKTTQLALMVLEDAKMRTVLEKKVRVAKMALAVL